MSVEAVPPPDRVYLVMEPDRLYGRSDPKDLIQLVHFDVVVSGTGDGWSVQLLGGVIGGVGLLGRADVYFACNGVVYVPAVLTSVDSLGQKLFAVEIQFGCVSHPLCLTHVAHGVGNTRGYFEKHRVGSADRGAGRGARSRRRICRDRA